MSLEIDLFGSDDDTDYPPSDVITGWPHHYIVNGDPSSCGCAEHMGHDDEWLRNNP